MQQRIEGRACSAVYVAAGGRVVLIGVTEQLVGCDWCGAKEFHYCGSIGPLALSANAEAQFQQIGDCLASEFALRGLFGVDAIINDAGVWPIEVNPRYTASVEVLEHALEVCAVAWHVEACENDVLLRDRCDDLRSLTRRGSPGRIVGKAILFARHDLSINRALSEELLSRAASSAMDSLSHETVTLADIPPAESLVPAHRPIMTLLATGASGEEVRLRLQSATEVWHRKFESIP